jgi:hypothetical protein
VKFEVQVDAERFLSGIKTLAKTMPEAEVRGLNNTAFIVRAALQSKIKQVFDRPTKRTINSPWVQKADAKAAELFVLIGVGDINAKSSKNSVPPSAYLGPQIDGGNRGQKRGEKAVFQHTAFPAMGGRGAKFLVPSKFAPIDDGHGNIPGSVWTKILSDIQGLSEVGFTGNRKAGKRGTAGGYFISKTKPMIMRRQGDVAISILIGVKSVSYQDRLPWYETIEQVWNSNIETELQKAIAYAIGSAW